MLPSRLGAERLNRRLWLVATTCVVAAYALKTASHFTQGELFLDDAGTFFVALLPIRDVLTVPTIYHAQPPLFYLVLRAWVHLGDSEPVLRALPMIFMVCAGLTLLSTSWLPPLARVVAAAVLLLTWYGEYLTSSVRPYSLSVWLSAWSCLLFLALLLGFHRRTAWYAGYVLVTVLMAYSLAMTSWILLAQGLCALVACGVAAARSGFRRACEERGALFLSLAAVAALYLPYVIGVWRIQGHLGTPSIVASLAAAANPRYFVSGPLYVLGLPAGLGYLALAVAVYAAANGARRRDPLVCALVTFVVVQIAMTHGFLEGRSPFGTRYLAPAYPALCLLVGLGADRLVARFRAASIGLAACAACVLVAALVVFLRAPHAPPVGAWRQVRADLQQLPGTKVVFFDIGWDALRLWYEVRHDQDVRIMSDPGSGWGTGGQLMTPEYVTRVVDLNAGPTTMFFYEFDPVTNGQVFKDAFAPGMVRHKCRRVYEREVPTYTRAAPGNTGALLYGYACDGV
jgi:hypothetical protein